MLIHSKYPLDLEIGMKYYVRPQVFLGGTAEHRKSIETFKVFEVGLDGAVAQPHKLNEGCRVGCSRETICLRYIMCKEGISTHKAIRVLMKSFGRKVFFAGLKDSEAYTCQFICIDCSPGEVFDCIYNIKGIMLYFVGLQDSIIRRGDLQGNLFEVLLHPKKTPNDLIDALNRVSNIINGVKFPNYFGYQRFGTRRPITHRIGKALVMKKWLDAVRLIAGEPLENEKERIKLARKYFMNGRYRKAYDLFPRSFDIERRVISEYAARGDPLRALRRIGKDYLALFIEGYQALVFNEALSRGIQDHGGLDDFLAKCEVLPLPGVNVRKRIDKCFSYVIDVLDADGVRPDDFTINELGLRVRGGIRETSFNVKGFSFKQDKDGRTWIRFCLPKGCYATVFLRELLRNDLILP